MWNVKGIYRKMLNYRCIKGCDAEFVFEDIFSVHTSLTQFATFRLRCPVCYVEQRMDVDLATYAQMIQWRDAKSKAK